MTVSEAFIQAYEARYPGSKISVIATGRGGYRVSYPGGYKRCMTAKELRQMTKHHRQMAEIERDIVRYDENA